MNGFSPAIAFALGLASTLHCWGMCGGIVGALSLSMPDDVRQSLRKRAALVAGYNFGRIASYSLAGALAGLTGATLLDFADAARIYLVMQWLGGAVIALIGLHLAGWLPRIAMLEAAGWRIWRLLQPLARRTLPIDSGPRALAAGAIWGWLPCGLVYSMLLWAATQADAVRGGASLCAFGLGTLPGMMTAGIAAGPLRNAAFAPGLRRCVGALLILAGIVFPAAQFASRAADAGAHHAHATHPG